MRDMSLRGWTACAVIGWLAASALFASATATLWSSTFEDVEIGEEPDGVIVLQGEFAVRHVEGNRVLELPGAPLDSMGMVLGPPRREDVRMTARILGERRGRQTPSFGIGLCGARGYRLIMAPMRDALELVLGDEVVGRADCTWKPGVWTNLRLEVVKSHDGWTVRGRAWDENATEPAEWAIRIQSDDPPPSGGATLWGMPYSGKPIRYDNVVYEVTE
jgi:hypothetical protein